MARHWADPFHSLHHTAECSQVMYLNLQYSWCSQSKKPYSHSQSKEKILGTGKLCNIFFLFQLFFAHLLGQYGLNCVAPMYSNCSKLLKGPWGHNQELKYLKPKLSGPKETFESVTLKLNTQYPFAWHLTNQRLKLCVGSLSRPILYIDPPTWTRSRDYACINTSNPASVLRQLCNTHW